MYCSSSSILLTQSSGCRIHFPRRRSRNPQTELARRRGFCRVRERREADTVSATLAKCPVSTAFFFSLNSCSLISSSWTDYGTCNVPSAPSAWSLSGKEWSSCSAGAFAEFAPLISGRADIMGVWIIKKCLQLLRTPYCGCFAAQWCFFWSFGCWNPWSNRNRVGVDQVQVPNSNLTTAEFWYTASVLPSLSDEQFSNQATKF